MSEIDWELLLRQTDEAVSPEASQQLSEWLRSDDRHPLLLAACREAAARVLSDPGVPPLRPVLSASPRSVRASKRVWLRGAAAAALLLGALGLWISAGRRNSTNQDATSPWQVVTTASGVRTTILLGDGTTVMLAAGSVLRYPSEPEPRTVQLEGEAYFVVAPDEMRPFRVHARDVIAEQRGTAFVVRSAPDDSTVTIIVREGRVALRSGAGTSRVLAAGDLGRVGRGSSEPQVEPVDVLAHLAWTEGRLVFEQTALPDALRQLERWYDVRFVLSDERLGQRRLTASLSERPLASVLSLLEQALDVRASVTGRTVTLIPVTAPTRPR